ncbi:MAG: right-handed parallel beta-helix repeat-containing protein [Mucilaginibacter sp.]
MKKYFKIGSSILILLLLIGCVKKNSNSPGPSGQNSNDRLVLPDTTSLGSNTPLQNIIYQTSTPISLYGAHNMVISGLAIQNPGGICIYLQDCSNITIRNCKLGPATQTGVELLNCTNITVDSCYISNVSTGLYAEQCASIQFNHNSVKNIQGPYPKGAMVQYNNVNGTGNKILFNRCENIAGASNPEDAISMYMSNGTPKDPIFIYGNWVRGGGPSNTGGGILLGDQGGSYIVAENNILVNPGNYGMGIAGGTYLQISNNKVYSKQTTVSNVGVYIWNQSSKGCSLNTISGNQVSWVQSDGEVNNSWDNGNCGSVTGWNSNVWGASLNENILPAVIISN